jgi:DNA invertase Pin-like site-specific DNA recombinase
MITGPKLTPERLSRRALVYVRQSTAGQVVNNLESQRRQYNLVDRARELGFHDVQTIDDDLGRSGGGYVERPGFQRLVAEVCAGQVGAVLCIEASRLARNGRDWHHLIELCGLVGAVVIDPDGIYDPAIINDRLLLGLKGTMSEFELNLLRQRSLEAIRQKAGRGELRFMLPAGFCWSHAGKIEKDPDTRIQHAINLVFSKMAELGSVRQVLLWLRTENISLPVATSDELGHKIIWKIPVYFNVHSIITNAMYAGAYVFGKTERRTQVTGGRARKTDGHRKPMQDWTVLIREHHPGYITWEQFERNQHMIAKNAHMLPGSEPKAGRGGRALLSGLMRCGRCGRKLNTWYHHKNNTIRYSCLGTNAEYCGNLCIAFSGRRVDKAVAEQILKAIAGDAVEAAIQAAEQALNQRRECRKALELELEQSRYEAHLASRRYEACDPENRLVAGELESRWNAALKRVAEIEDRLRKFDLGPAAKPVPDRQLLENLAHDLPAIWNSPICDMRLKQRIVRILIREIIANVDEEKREIVLMIHWAGGRHSELRVPKPDPGKHGRCTSLEAIEVLREMAGIFPDKEIAATLNRLRMRTGAGNTWTPMRVASARCHHGFPAYSSSDPKPDLLTLEQAAARLGISETTTKKLIDAEIIKAHQVVAFAPWRIPPTALETEAVKRAVSEIKQGRHAPRPRPDMNQQLVFSST